MAGEEVADPYRWLEDGTLRETKQWVDSQDRLARGILAASPSRRSLERGFRALARYDLIPPYAVLPPRRDPDTGKTRFFWLRRGRGKKQSALRYQDGLRTSSKVAIDPLRSDPRGTTSLLEVSPSWDGSLVLYGLSVHGSDRTELKVRDVRSGKSFDRIPDIRYACVAWRHDGTGFYYSTWDEPGRTASKRTSPARLFFHRLRTPWTADVPLFGEGLAPTQGISDLVIDPHDRHLVVFVEELSESTDLYHLDLVVGGNARPLVAGLKSLVLGEGNASIRDDRLIAVTEHRAPKRRVVAIPLERPDEASWRELVPETDDVLDGMAVVGGEMILRYLREGSSRLVVRRMDGNGHREIPLPGIGSVVWPPKESGGDEAAFGFVSFDTPPTLYRLGPVTGRLAVFDRSRIPLPRGGLDTRLVRYPSKDGTEVSMFVVRRKGARNDGPSPSVLEAYGGFGIALSPRFDLGLLPFLRNGGVYAAPQIRGGGERGRAWHDAGRRERKQNTFDDFIAAAEWLIRENYTDPRHLAIRGASNGGLLVGAAITQRPELFRAAVCAVPLLDMLRYHRFDGGALWVPEYGSPDDPEMFPYLRAYSPYHRVRPGVRYPAVLLMTADTDTRVNPLHARKMAARLQAASSSGLPVLLRTERRTGHGFGKSVDQIVDSFTTNWSFLYDQLGIVHRAQ
jgi:prolyl oligopeptidase